MGSHYEAPIRRPLVAGEKSYHDVTVDIAKPIETKANKQWWIVFTISLVMFLWGLGCIIYTISTSRVNVNTRCVFNSPILIFNPYIIIDENNSTTM